MKKSSIPALLIVVLSAGVLLVSCTKKIEQYSFFPDYQTGYKVVNSDTKFNWDDLVFSEEGRLGVDDRLWLSAVGDVTGDSADEVIITHSKGVDILDQEGRLLSTLFEPGYIVESIILHDINQDGKKEILLGKQGASTVGFTVIDGGSKELMDVSFLKSPRARTMLHFVYENSVYLTSSPLYNIAPKIAAAVDLETGEPDFVYHSAPLVTGLYRGEYGNLAIGNHGMGRERKTVEVPYRGEYNKPAVLIIDEDSTSQSTEVIYEALGSEVKEGDSEANPITEVITKLVDIDGDGNEEIISLLETESAYTRGDIRLELRNSDGTLRTAWVGPEEEKGDFIFYFDEDKFRIMLILSYSSKVLILDEDLNPVTEKELFPEHYYHELTLHHYGDINGDGKMDYLLSDAGTLIVLDQNLNLQFSYFFNGFIETVHLIPNGSNTKVLVQAGDLYPLIIDKKLTEKELSSQKQLSQSRQQVEFLKEDAEGSLFYISYSQRHKTEPLSFDRNPQKFKPVLDTILFPEEYAIRYAEADILGDERKEILVSLVYKRKVAVMDNDYQILDYLEDPVQVNYTGRPTITLLRSVPDLTGDGKAELAPMHYGSIYSTIINGQGQVLQNHLFSHGYDTDSGVFMEKDGVTQQEIRTGYLLYPRGTLYYDTHTQKYISYNPSAVMSGYAFNEYFDGYFYYGTFTSSNGSEYTHPNGTLEKDTEYFFHVAKEGNFSPELSQKYPENEENNGRLYPFVLDLWSNLEQKSVETLVYATSRMKDYYPGAFEFFTFNFETAKRTVLFTGPENGEIMSIDTALYRGQNVYALFFKHNGTWIVDNKFSIIKKIDINNNASLNQLVADFDGDGTSEFMRVESNRLVIIDIDGNELTEIKVPGGVTPKFITNIEQLEDGTIRITVSMKKGIYVYTM